MGNQAAAFIFICLYLALGVSLTVFVLYLFWRMVRAHERAASALERFSRGGTFPPV